MVNIIMAVNNIHSLCVNVHTSKSVMFHRLVDSLNQREA